MSITVEISEAKRSSLEAQAEARGIEAENLAARWLLEKLDLAERESICATLQDWLENGDEEEQTETWEILRTGLDANREGERRRFPE